MNDNDIEKYKEEFRKSSSKVLLAAVGFINPLFGITLAIANEGIDFRNRIEQQRINSLVIELNNRVDELESKITPLGFFSEDEFYDLSLNVYEAAIRTSSEEKHKIISKIFINSIDQNCDWDDDLDRIFLDVVKDFSQNHFLVLKFLSKNTHREELRSYEQLHQEFEKTKGKEIDIYQFRHYCKEIESKTLMRFSKDIIEIGSSGGVMETDSYKGNRGIALTSLGDQFIKLYS